MNLYELKKTLESEASIENEKLKKDIECLKKVSDDKIKQLENEIEDLKSDCKALSNRCWAYSSLIEGGPMCYFCGLKKYKCAHSVSFRDKIKFAKNLKNKTEGENDD